MGKICFGRVQIRVVRKIERQKFEEQKFALFTLCALRQDCVHMYMKTLVYLDIFNCKCILHKGLFVIRVNNIT